MNKKLILSAVFLTIFLDFFNLGLIYPIFTSMVFGGNGGLVSPASSVFYKNALFGTLIAAFPFGQFLGAPIIGQLSDQYGRRKLLTASLIGTVVTLGLCALAIHYSSLSVLYLGRFIGGLMAGNMTLAYASLADLSSENEKVKNFALIPLATGMGFAMGPYVAGIVSNPEIHSYAGPALPFLLGALLSFLNLILVIWKFPETSTQKPCKNLLYSALQSMTQLSKALQLPSMGAYIWILFLMISSNLVFVQFVGPYAADRYSLNITEVGYLYANIGVAVSIGHLFVTRRLADRLSPETALLGGLSALVILLITLLNLSDVKALHLLTFFVMLGFAVAYTNAMALVSDKAPPEKQGEIMGVAVSIQSCAEFLPASLLGMAASLTLSLPLFAAAVFAGCAGMVLILQRKKEARCVNFY